MKYKRKITSGALALTLFVGGSSAYAANIQGQAGAGISPHATQFHNAKGRQGPRGLGLNHNRVIGEVVAFTSTGFTLEAHGPRAPHEMIPFDIKTTSATVYQKDGAASTVADLAVGQKVIVVGNVDPTAQIVTASKVNIITRLPDKPVRGPKKF